MTVMRENDDLDWTVVDHRTSDDVAFALYEASSLAVHLGAATELIRCTQCGELTHIDRITHTPGTPRDFNAGEALLLHCGHWIV